MKYRLILLMVGDHINSDALSFVGNVTKIAKCNEIETDTVIMFKEYLQYLQMVYNKRRKNEI